ncbi:embden-meyerhof pathway-1 [Diaporthe helianthi]|uniref:Phosphotransferase n=1 Tax=Diaporthe helianthi TaxID=158607 RepID=A0A2P5HV92_DIAHE|nr:embden-meyerhof pathway-1 [Diaporthe helianthi]
MTALVAGMRSAGTARNSKPKAEEMGHNETEIVPTVNGKTRSKSIVPLPPVLEQEIQSLRDAFTITTSTLKEIVNQFEKELADGLEKDFQNIAMYPTWVFGFPSGHEDGQFLTIDLGGTNLRVCWITLKGKNHNTDIVQDMYKVPEEIKTGSADQLWDLIADALMDFLEKHQLKGTEDEPLPLGFTFSYPVQQDYIDRGRLVTWTKGFNIEGVEQEDGVIQLGEALARRKLPVRIIALINDTVGAMIASAYKDPETIIGAIFGTGCNAAYMEDVGSVPKISGSGLAANLPLAINCEYGAFDNSHRVLPRTKYDIGIDNESVKPGEQAFEKMSAGLYLGELFRLVLLDLYERGILFRGRDLPKLKETYCMDTGFLSCLENDPLDARVARYKEVLGCEPTQAEVEFSRLLAEVIAVRGARLCACGIAAICKRKAIGSGHVAADGSVANKHPRFKARWAEALGEILDWPVGRECDPITITSAEDGSGIGAAIITSMTMANIRAGDLKGVRDGGQYIGKK